MSNNVINISEWRQPRKYQKNKLDILQETLYTNTISTLQNHSINIEQTNTAFDIATIHYLTQGMLARSQNEPHPSLPLLDKIRAMVSETANVGCSL